MWQLSNKRICDDDDDTTIIIISIITANYHVVLALHSYHCDCKFSADLVFFYATNGSWIFQLLIAKNYRSINKCSFFAPLTVSNNATDADLSIHCKKVHETWSCSRQVQCLATTHQQWKWQCRPAWKPNRTTERYVPKMPGNSSGGKHIRHSKSNPQAKMMSRLTNFLSAISDTKTRHVIVAQLSIETAQTARCRETPTACAQLTVWGT